MNFELLPNEIILDLFEYFSTIHLFHAFFGLNSRFNKLISQQFQKFHLDFLFISKTNFNHFCQNYLPSIIDRIISLRLSNDNNTPQQIELFLSHNYRLRQFTHLQSISLLHLQSQQTLDQIMIDCSYLPYLTHLAFTDSRISMNENNANRFFNQIWSLSKLTYCYLNNCFNYKNYFPNPTVISPSLRHLSIPNTTCSFSTLTHLCQYTPNLQYLSVTFIDNSDQLELSLSILSIIRLKISFNGSLNILEHLLQNLPNLYHLSLETYDICINGYEWEEMIKNISI
jgi:AAA+ ATPase superfamily predicted ATPase